jgi:hypothetical protein
VTTALTTGVNAVLDADRLVAAFERQSYEDLVKSLVHGTLGFQPAGLAGLPAAAAVVQTATRRSRPRRGS